MTQLTSAPETGGRRERAKAEKRSRILAAARRLLSAQGYDRMTMADVAAAADVAVGTVFQYAATKPELLMMVTADQWRDLLRSPGPADDDAHRDTDDDDTDARIRRLLDPLVAWSVAQPELTVWVARELLFGADGTHRAEVAALIEQLEGTIREVLREAGAATHADPAARLVISGMLVELNRTREGRAGTASLGERLDSLIGIVLRGAEHA